MTLYAYLLCACAAMVLLEANLAGGKRNETADSFKLYYACMLLQVSCWARAEACDTSGAQSSVDHACAALHSSLQVRPWKKIVI